MQLCVNVQIPKSIGGAGGEALYVDSEGSFIVDRLVQIAQGTIDAINPRLVGQGKGDDMMEMEKMLDKVHYFRVHDYVEQVAVTQLLAETLEQHPNVSCLLS
jgi:RAD51-like protein 2